MAVRAPLSGYRIVDLTTVVAGPYATQVLADLGADVIKVEGPAGDPMRHAGPSAATAGMAPIHMTLNRNKRSLCLDLKQADALAAMGKLIESADALVTNVRPAGLARLGLDYAGARALRSDLVYVHLVGFGEGGPYAGQAAYDDLVQAGAGLADLSTQVDPDSPPRFVPSLIADKVTGLHAVYALLAALLQRERTGEGQFVEVPMLETTVTFNLVEHLFGHVHSPPSDRWGYPRVVSPHRRPHRTRDHFVAIMPYDDAQWRAFFSVAGRPDLWLRWERSTLEERTAHIDDLYASVSEVTETRTTDEWLALLGPHGIPCMRVNRLEDLEADPHLRAVGLFERVRHPTEGEYLSLRHPVRFAGAELGQHHHPAHLGEDGREVLAELGLDDDAIDALLAKPPR